MRRVLDQALHDELVAALKAFRKRRDDEGGILLPDKAIAEHCFFGAMVEVGLEKPPPTYVKERGVLVLFRS